MWPGVRLIKLYDHKTQKYNGLLDDADLRPFVILALEMSWIEQKLRISFYITRKVVRLLMHVVLVLVLSFIFF